MRTTLTTTEQESPSDEVIDTLLTERDVSDRSGLPGPLVETLLHSVSPDDVADYHTEAPVYSEEDVYRAQLAVFMLNASIRMRYIHAAMREPRTLEQLQTTVAQLAETCGYILTARSRQTSRPRFNHRLRAAIRGRRTAVNTAGHTHA